jgi:hypothetical protein
VEARYIRGFTSRENTDVVPLTVGLRW